MRRHLLAENINAKHSERLSNTVILMRGTYSAIFFSKNRIKNQHLFSKSGGFWNRKGWAYDWHAFLASPVKNSGVTCFIRKTEKNSKIAWFSRYFKNLLHVGLSIRYLTEKKNKNIAIFERHISVLKKFFPKNWIFSIFAKNRIKNSYFWKRIISSEREKWSEFFDLKSVKIERKLRPKKFV